MEVSCGTSPTKVSVYLDIVREKIETMKAIELSNKLREKVKDSLVSLIIEDRLSEAIDLLNCHDSIILEADDLNQVIAVNKRIYSASDDNIGKRDIRMRNMEVELGFQLARRLSSYSPILVNLLVDRMVSLENEELAFELVDQAINCMSTKEFSNWLKTEKEDLKTIRPILSFCCKNISVDMVAKIENRLESLGLELQETQLVEILEMHGQREDNLSFYRYMHELRKKLKGVSGTTFDFLKRWFTEAKVEIPYLDMEHLENVADEKGGWWHGEGWAGTGKWLVKDAKIKADGTCEGCEKKLIFKFLDNVESKKVQANIQSQLIRFAGLHEFEEFKEWVDKRKPFKVVIDGANAGFISPNGLSTKKLDEVIKEVHKTTNQLPMVILPFTKFQAIPKSDSPLRSWVTDDILYVAPKSIYDDWYWVYMALNSNCYFLSNDQLNDHKVFEKKTFLSGWKQAYQITFDPKKEGIELTMPHHASMIHESPDGSWHIPRAIEKLPTSKKNPKGSKKTPADKKDTLDADPLWLCATPMAKDGNDGEDAHKGKLSAGLNSAIVREKPNVKWNDVPVRSPQFSTGKSCLAKAVAFEADSTYFRVSYPIKVSKWMGTSERLVAGLLKMPHYNSPSIIFIDEIDFLLERQHEGNESEVSRPIKTKLLVQMQGVGRDDDKVLVLVATNTPDPLTQILGQLQSNGLHYTIINDKETRNEDMMVEQSRTNGFDGTGALGLTGLFNLGNTCYMNSAIQCLAHTPRLVCYFLGNFREDLNYKNPRQGKVALAFGNLVSELCAPGATTVAPEMLMSTISSSDSNFSGYGQHDAQDKFSRWYKFDDSSVTPVTEEQIKTKAAYVLFYERI